MDFLRRLVAIEVIRQVRHYHRKRRDVARELGLEETSEKEHEKLLARSVDPVEAAIGNERMEQLLAGKPQLHRDVLELRARGMTEPEIAADRHIHERSVRRILARYHPKKPR